MPTDNPHPIPNAGPPVRLNTHLQLVAGSDPDDRSANPRAMYHCRLVRAGRIRRADGSPGPFYIPAQAIAAAVLDGQFDAKAMFVDHADIWEGPSLRNLAGVTLTASYNPHDEAAEAAIRLYDNTAGQIVATLFDQILRDAATAQPAPDVGLSLVFYPEWQPAESPHDTLTLAAFRHVESVDFVFQPAADGRVTEALTALAALGQAPTIPSHAQERSATVNEHNDNPGAAPDAAPPTQPPAQSADSTSARQWMDALAAATCEAIIDASGLPTAVRAWLHTQHYTTPDQVREAIDAQRQVLAELQAANVVQVGGTPPRSSGISVGLSSLDQITAALDALIAGVNPPGDVRPLTGLRELYTLLSGDYEMTGRFHSDRVALANVTSSTMAGLVANALNKRVINLFQEYPRWWEPIVVEEDFSTLQQVKWITLGGVGELPTVAEGAAYTELTWDDQTETATFVKKGGYLGLTLEAMDKDDTRRLRAAPRALAQAAWLTLSKLVSAIFTDNSGTGPAMADGGQLFNATAVSTTGGHANLLTTALSYAEWHVVRIAMMKQPEVNSGERLGALTAPRYCLVPIDLEETALQIFASEGEPGTANNDENVAAEGNNHNARMNAARSRVIVVPLWTDTDNWAAVADPRLYPSIGIGYRYGRQPEVFSVASPTAGLMFTNDTMPVKVRFFVAVGPTDWRGLHKSNV